MCLFSCVVVESLRYRKILAYLVHHCFSSAPGLSLKGNKPGHVFYLPPAMISTRPLHHPAPRFVSSRAAGLAWCLKAQPPLSVTYQLLLRSADIKEVVKPYRSFTQPCCLGFELSRSGVALTFEGKIFTTNGIKTAHLGGVRMAQSSAYLVSISRHSSLALAAGEIITPPCD